MEHYCFIGAACLMFFCIKLLYVDDSDTLAEDHALLVNRYVVSIVVVVVCRRALMERRWNEHVVVSDSLARPTI